MVVFKAFNRKLVELRVSGDTRLVIDWLCMKVDKGNTIEEVIQGDIARDCGMHRSNVCTALGRLEKLEILLRGRRGAIWLNPQYMFHGNPAEQHVAIEKWKRLWQEKTARRQEVQDGGN